MARLTVALAALAAAAAAFAAPSPEQLQARYDRARDTEERLLAARTPDAAALRRVRADIRAVEVVDARPRSWRRGRDVPQLRLPKGSLRARAPRRRDDDLARRLAALGAGFSGWAGFWVHDLTTGATAGWNSDARFPAASTVKLGVVGAALRAYGAHPERSRAWYELRQITGWSSNLAANRLHARLGSAAVGTAMRRLGMYSSTYPGPFRAGTSVADAPKPPPHSHWRVTTPRDLGRALYAFHAAAAGNRYVQRQSGLSRRQARLALALLVTSSTAYDNAGLLRPWLPPGVRVAQKNGWISDTRITAAIVYARSGPKIVVVAAYRPQLPRHVAVELGERVVEAAGLRP